MIVLNWSPEAEAVLAEIQVALGLPNRAEVVRKALGLLRYVMAERKKGGKLIIENESENLRKEITDI